MRCTAQVETLGRTGVEMEALTAVQIGLLTIYDMCKAADRGMVIDDIRVLEKHGGKSGDWVAPADRPRAATQREVLERDVARAAPALERQWPLAPAAAARRALPRTARRTRAGLVVAEFAQPRGEVARAGRCRRLRRAPWPRPSSAACRAGNAARRRNAAIASAGCSAVVAAA